MNRSLMKASLALASFAALPAFAADSDAQIRNLDNRVTALEQRKGSGGVILPSAGANLDNDIGLSIGADFLLWETHVTGTSYAQSEAPSASLGGDEVLTQGKELHGRLTPGFRLTFGFRPGHDDWQVNTTWTHFYSKANGHSSTVGSTSLLVPNDNLAEVVKKFDTSGSIQQANAHWRMMYNTIDLNVNRAFYVSKWLSLRPVLGLRNLWLDQKYTTNFPNVPNDDYTSVTLQEKDKYNFWGLGPNAALNTVWGLGHGFSIFGDAGISLLWGFIDKKVETFCPQATSQAYTSYTDSYHLSAPATDLSIGLGWDKHFYDNQFHFGVKAGWEHHAIWDAAGYGDLTMQGFTLAFAFDF